MIDGLFRPITNNSYCSVFFNSPTIQTALSIIAGLGLIAVGTDIFFRATVLNATSIKLMTICGLGGVTLIGLGVCFFPERSGKFTPPSLDSCMISRGMSPEGGKIMYFDMKEASTERSAAYSVLRDYGCPFFTNLKIKDTSTLVFVPPHLIGGNYNLEKLLKWIKQNLEVDYDVKSFRNLAQEVRSYELAEYFEMEPFFIIPEKNVLEGNSTEDKRQGMIDSLTRNEGKYNYPNLAEAVIYLAMSYQKDREDIPWFFCRNLILNKERSAERTAISVIDGKIHFRSVNLQGAAHNVGLRPIMRFTKGEK